jgi:NAD(P)-dependent dehydrogenase (short-subunit alcohol dehydrogenase family)
VLTLYPDEPGIALQNELNAVGPGEAFYIHCDVTKEDDVKAIYISVNLFAGFLSQKFSLFLQNLIFKAVDKFGHLYCLINNAGWRT